MYALAWMLLAVLYTAGGLAIIQNCYTKWAQENMDTCGYARIDVAGKVLSKENSLSTGLSERHSTASEKVAHELRINSQNRGRSWTDCSVVLHLGVSDWGSVCEIKLTVKHYTYGTTAGQRWDTKERWNIDCECAAGGIKVGKFNGQIRISNGCKMELATTGNGRWSLAT